MKKNLKPEIGEDNTFLPEFKLRVVLEYVKNPELCNEICADNAISESLLIQWHQEFMDKAGDIFKSVSPAAPSVEPPPRNSPTPSRKFEPPPVKVTPGWGVRINKGYGQSVSSASSSTAPPSWLRREERAIWQSGHVVIWDDSARKISELIASHTLELLEQLRTRGYWRTEGIPITRRVHKLKVAEPDAEAADKRGAKEKKKAYEAVDEVLWRLNPAAGEEVFAFLQQQEEALRQLVEVENLEMRRHLGDLFKLMYEEDRQKQEREIELSKRPLKWTHPPQIHTFVCEPKPNRGTITLGEYDFFWHVCIERPDQFKQSSPPFAKLAEAMTWTEKELAKRETPAPTLEKAQVKDVVDHHMGSSPIDLTPYWINPHEVEHAPVTYRAMLELEHVPESFKTMEMSFGKPYRYDEKFPSETELLAELQIDANIVTVRQLLGPDTEWYWLLSVNVYAESEEAKTAAQRLWIQSTMQTLYQNGKVRRARFGIEEVETRFRVWLGELEDPEKPWDKPESRAEHMKERALRETLAYALDVQGYRDWLGFGQEEMSDNDLLTSLHRIRVQSQHVPAKVRAQSKRWLAKHVGEDSVQSSSGANAEVSSKAKKWARASKKSTRRAKSAEHN